MLDIFKVSFLKSARRFYPTGLNTTDSADIAQWKIVVQMAVAIYLNALLEAKKIVLAELLNGEVERLMTRDWIPDNSWRWW